MKQLNNFILEKLQISRNKQYNGGYNYDDPDFEMMLAEFEEYCINRNQEVVGVSLLNVLDNDTYTINGVEYTIKFVSYSKGDSWVNIKCQPVNRRRSRYKSFECYSTNELAEILGGERAVITFYNFLNRHFDEVK
jgi:hypothetical protein